LPVPDGVRYFEARLVVSGPDEVMAMVRDVTAQKRAEIARAAAEAARAGSEEALRQSERTFRTLIEAAPIGTCVMTAQGRFTTVNDAYCALTGYTREELLTGEVAVGDLHPPRSARPTWRSCTRVSRSG
jgi:PAS domain-containing protein